MTSEVVTKAKEHIRFMLDIEEERNPVFWKYTIVTKLLEIAQELVTELEKHTPADEEKKYPGEPDQIVLCKVCGGKFVYPAVDTMHDAKLVYKDKVWWERVRCKIICDDCGYSPEKWGVGVHEAWDIWEEANK